MKKGRKKHLNEIIVNQNLNNSLTEEKNQTNFLQTNIGKAINAGLNIRN